MATTSLNTTKMLLGQPSAETDMASILAGDCAITTAGTAADPSRKRARVDDGEENAAPALPPVKAQMGAVCVCRSNCFCETRY